MPIRPKQILNRSFYVLIKGTTLAQLVAFAIYPILTRLYSPEAFGEKSIFVAILNVAIVFASLSYEVAIPITKEKKQAIAIVAGGLVVSLLVSGLVSLLFFLTPLSSYLAFRSWYFWFLPPGIVLGAIFKIGFHYSIREEWFKLITQSRIMRSVGRAGTELIGGIMRWGSIGLIAAYLIGFGGGVILFGRKFYRDLRNWYHTYKLRDQYHQIVRAFKDFRHFPLNVSLANLFHLLSLQLPIYFLAQYSTAWVGQFNLAMLGVNTGAVILLDAFSQLYLSDLRKHATLKSQSPLFLKLAFARIFLLGFVPAILLHFLGPPLLPLILGEEWQPAGQLCTITAWLLPAMFFHNLGFHTFNQLKRPFFTLTADTLTFLIASAALWYDSQNKPSFSPAEVLLKYVVITNFFYFILAVYSIRQYRNTHMINKRGIE